MQIDKPAIDTIHPSFSDFFSPEKKRVVQCKCLSKTLTSCYISVALNETQMSFPCLWKPDFLHRCSNFSLSYCWKKHTFCKLSNHFVSNIAYQTQFWRFRERIGFNLIQHLALIISITFLPWQTHCLICGFCRADWFRRLLDKRSLPCVFRIKKYIGCAGIFKMLRLC